MTRSEKEERAKLRNMSKKERATYIKNHVVNEKILINRKRNSLIFLVLCAAITVFEIIGSIICFKELQWSMFIYYTQLSNLFLLFSAIIGSLLAIHTIWFCPLKDMPSWFFKLFHAATSATTLTLLVVVFVLSKTYGSLSFVLTDGAMLYLHTICPILALVAFFFCIPRCRFPVAKLCLRASVFTLLYAAIAIAMNILKVWHGPYPFLFVYEQPIWASVAWTIGILGGAFLISLTLYAAHSFFRRKANKRLYPLG